MRTTLNPPTLAKPRGFSHGVAVRGGTQVFLSGQTGSDLSGAIAAPGDLVAQFRLALENLKNLVEAAGGSVTDIVKLNLLVRDCDDYRAKLRPIGEAYRAVLGDHFPAMTLAGTTGLFQPDALVEIEGIAVIE